MASYGQGTKLFLRFSSNYWKFEGPHVVNGYFDVSSTLKGNIEGYFHDLRQEKGS